MSRRVAKLIFTNWLSQCDRPRRSRMPFAEDAEALFTPDPNDSPPPGGLATFEINRWLQRTRFAMVILPASLQIVDANDREQARLRLLEAVLALQLYHRERGHYPDSLENLVGSGLDELPVDPFGPGEPVHYRQADQPADGFTVWSIGPDAVDDEGRVDLNNDGKTGDIRYTVNSSNAARKP
jgi:type II secretory pathway pseudopilin PulG